MMIEVRRQSDDAEMLINSEKIIAIFDSKYPQRGGSVIRLKQGTYEVRESLETLKKKLNGKG